MNVLIWLSVIPVLCWAQDGPIVETSYGLLEGVSEIDLNGRDYDVFRGIPFALPPVGELRFTKPQPPLAWEGIRPAKENGLYCTQVVPFTNTSEDCLFLNVYVPFGIEDAEDLPVMFYIHGGAFIFGSGAGYEAEDLALRGPVIVVTINYRLGPIGFLSTEDDIAPGNYGLWDAQLALLWVNENIANFGGDPSRITVFGQSAGAAATSHLMVSPQSNELFQRGIPISGSSSGFFGHNYPGGAAASTNSLAFSMGCRRLNGSEEIVECLREADAEELNFWGFVAIVTLRQQLPSFIPCIDGDFVSQFPRQSWEEGAADHLDLMTGFTQHDAAGFTLVNLNGRNQSIPSLAWSLAFTRFSIAFMVNHMPGRQEAIEAIYDKYENLADNDTDIRTIEMTNMGTDWWFGSASTLEAYLHALSSGPDRNTYHYNFNYRHDFIKFPEEWVEGSHYHDLYSVFGEPYNYDIREAILAPDWEFTEADKEVARVVQEYYTNFAYSGNPNSGPHQPEVNWPEYYDTDTDDRQLMRFRETPAAELESEEQRDLYDWWNGEFLDIAWQGDMEDSLETEIDPEDMIRDALEILIAFYGQDHDLIQYIEENKDTSNLLHMFPSSSSLLSLFARGSQTLITCFPFSDGEKAMAALAMSGLKNCLL